jgi:DNA polymerase-1
MSIKVTKREDFKGFDSSSPYSITIKDEELLGVSICITQHIGASEYNEYSLELVTFTELIATMSKDVILISDDSKELYKSYPALIDTTLIIFDVSLASYINNGAAKHDIESQRDFFSLSKDIHLGVLLIELFLQWNEIFDQKVNDLWKLENEAARVLAIMELNGIKIDKDKLTKLKYEYEKEAQKLTKEIQTLLENPEVNINSPKQLGEALVIKGFKLGKPGKSGAPSVKESVLESLLSSDTTGVIQKILDYRTVQKMYSTYTDSLLVRLDEEDRLHGEFKQTVAATGRLSSTNPNLQNIPIRHPKYGSDLRSVFISKKGYTLISADYSQIELRILAHLSKDPRLVEAFKKDQDIHSVTASEVFGIELDTVDKQQRGVGKTLNFALMYQQGVSSTAKQLGISTKEAKEYIETFFNKFKNIKPFTETILKDGAKNGYVESLYGRKVYYPDLNSNQGFLKAYAERAAFNMPMQGTESEIVKMAMIRIQEEIEKQDISLRILLQIHDEIVFEVATSELETTLPLIKESMELDQPLSVPLKVEIHTGKNWNEAK